MESLDLIVWIGAPIAVFLGNLVFKRLPKRWQVRVRRWLPNPGTALMGLIIGLYGMMTLTGATLSIQITGAVEPGVSEIQKFSDPFISWLIIGLGLDFLLTGGRLIPWIIAHIIIPPLERVLAPIGTAIKESDIGLYVQQRWTEYRIRKEPEELR